MEGILILVAGLAILWMFSTAPLPWRASPQPPVPAPAGTPKLEAASTSAPTKEPPAEEALEPPVYRRLSDEELRKTIPPGSTIDE